MALSDAYLASIIESSDDAIIAKNLDGIVTSWNRAAEIIFGYTAAEMIGRSIEQIVPPDRRHEMRTILERIKAGDRIHHFETLRQRKDGGVIPVSLSISPILNEKGRVIGAAKIVRDISDRRATESRLAEIERRYGSALAASAIGTWRIDLEAGTASRDSRACRLLGLPEDLLESSLDRHTAYVHPDDRPRLLRAMEAAAHDDVPLLEDYRVVTPGGEPRWLRDRGRTDPGAPQGALSLTGCLVDITEQTAVSRELSIEHARIRSMLDRLPVGVVVVDLPSERIALSNPSAERILGHGPLGATLGEEIPLRQGMSVSGIPYAPGDWPACRTIHTGETVLNEEIVIRQQDRSERAVVVTTEIIPGADGTPVGVLATYDDITDRRQSEERYRLVFEASPIPLWVYDLETLQFLAVNQAAVTEYGFSRDEFLAMTIRDIRPVDDVPHLLDRIERLELGVEKPDWSDQPERSWRHRRKDGSILHVDIRSHPMLFLGRPARIVIAMDVTAKQRLEDQLRQSQKMEAIGQLAGGIAHDFNNLLTVIGGYANLSLLGLPQDHPARAHLAHVVAASERAAALTHQLLAFGRKQVLQPRLLNLNSVVEGMRPLLVRLLREDIQLDLRLDPGLCHVEADLHQLELVLMNLVLNASDAMAGGGVVTIETRETHLDEEYAAMRVGVRPGSHAQLAVSDTGHGMDAQTQSRVFEPFFTTKPVGKGTGLGLSTAFGIVKQSGGHIAVYSEVGVGTTFKVYLPAAGALARVAETKPAVTALGGTETILLVEDDAGVREFATRSLRALGYAVHEAASGEQALRIGRMLGDGVDLLLTDVVMPNLGGRQIADALAPICRKMRVLFMSGYTQNAIAQHGVLDPGLEYLPKPFNTKSLGQRVREVLSSPQRPRSIVVVAGDPAIGAFLSDALGHSGYAVEVVTAQEDAVAIGRRRPVDLLVVDAAAAPEVALASIGYFDHELPHVRMVAVASNWDNQLQREARRAGAAECLPKPLALDQILKTVRDLIG